MFSNKGALSFAAVVSTIGAILIACGIAWLIATNWHQINDFIKILILVVITAGAYSAGIALRVKGYGKIGGSLLVLGALVYTLSIFLIAQIFSTSTTLQGISWLLFLALIGVVISAYVFRSPTTLVVALIEFLFWISFQFAALTQRDYDTIGIFALLYLVVGILFYGLSVWHKVYAHPFNGLYRGWTAFYLLLFAYLLTFQEIIPHLWPGEAVAGGRIIFLGIAGIVALLIFIVASSIALRRGTVRGKEVSAMVALIVLFGIIIALAGAVGSSVGTCYPKQCYDFTDATQCNATQLPNTICRWENNHCQQIGCYIYQNEIACLTAPPPLQCSWINTSFNSYCQESTDPGRGNAYEITTQHCGQFTNNREACTGDTTCNWRGGVFYGWGGRTQNAPLSLLLIWVFANVVFILFILAIIGYGTLVKSSTFINLGMGAFVLEIVSRYIGFIMDLSGYKFILPFTFITGGLLLIGGGWLIERWRRRLIAQTKMNA